MKAQMFSLLLILGITESVYMNSSSLARGRSGLANLASVIRFFSSSDGTNWTSDWGGRYLTRVSFEKYNESQPHNTCLRYWMYRRKLWVLTLRPSRVMWEVSMLRIACLMWRAAGSLAKIIPTVLDLLPSRTVMNFAAGFSVSKDFRVSIFFLVKRTASWS